MQCSVSGRPQLHNPGTGRRQQVISNAAEPAGASVGVGAEAAAAAAAAVESVKAQLRARLAELSERHGAESALLPGHPDEKGEIDGLISELVRLQQQADGSSSSSGGDVRGACIGEWELVYASNGTVVTRTPLVRLLVMVSRALPGAGISDIWQQLSEGGDGAGLRVSNDAVLGLGPLGSWRIGIEGAWVAAGGGGSDAGRSVQVVFEKLRVKLVGLLGVPLPAWLPQVDLGPFGSQPRAGAEWVTPFVDADVRVGMGAASGNHFLFMRTQAHVLPR